jgi:hypothetical protein
MLQPTRQYATQEDAPCEREYVWPESELFVSDKHRLVYCPIPKVACSSLKIWWATVVDGGSASFTWLDEKGKTCVDHSALNERFKLHHQAAELGRHPLTDDDWFRFAFVRNPWSRLVSSFLNKFLPLLDVSWPVFRQVHSRRKNRKSIDDPSAISQPFNSTTVFKRIRDSIRFACWGERAWQDLFTFRHFVEFLTDCDLLGPDVELHWCPQFRFLGVVRFDFIGKFERLASDFQVVARRLGVRAELPELNCTDYQRRKLSKDVFADCTLSDLRRLRALPDYRQFYTPQLIERVADLYHIDVERFGYEFED